MSSVDIRTLDTFHLLRRRFNSRRKMFCGPAVAVPVLNLALLLILFLVLNSAFVLQPGVVVDLPTAAFTGGVVPGAMVVTITKSGLIFFNDEQATLDSLQATFARAVFDQPDTPLIIEADGDVRHNTIVRVYSMATSVGIQQVLLATRGAPAPARAGQ